MKYRVTMNGKPVREAPEPCELDEAKVAAFDIEVALVKGDPNHAICAAQMLNGNFAILVQHHDGADFIEIEAAE